MIPSVSHTSLNILVSLFFYPFLVPAALSLALFLVIVEVVLGVMLLIGYKAQFTWSLLLMIVFFYFLNVLFCTMW
jgi:uncharacterized membrane protein YphA (DoxX/SURF4 family)